MILRYDFSFAGLLTAVFKIYEEKIEEPRLMRPLQTQGHLFAGTDDVITDKTHAARVWKGIAALGGTRAQQLVYKVFLSELPEMEELIISFLRAFFNSQGTISKNPSHPATSRMLQIEKMIGREKHRMDAFIRFMETKDGWYVATVSPDFNVLPLNARHFKERYADQHWLIYDTRRNYGLFYDEHTVAEVTLETKEASALSQHITSFCLSEEELQFQELWKSYFKHTNIQSRKNMTLHLKHVPKRYWKYLIEKQPILKK